MDDHKIGLEPRKTNKPSVNFLSKGSLAQFAFEKAERIRGLGERCMPKCKVPLT